MIVRCPRNTTQKTLRVVIRDPAGEPRSGLGPRSPGAAAFFIADGSAKPTAIDLVEPQSDGFTPGSFSEIDAAAMPGLYELGLPNELFAAEGNSAVVMLRFEGAAPAVIHFDLVGYDPYDSVRLGLSCLSQEARHACLSSAFQTIVPEIVDELLRVEGAD